MHRKSEILKLHKRAAAMIRAGEPEEAQELLAEANALLLEEADELVEETRLTEEQQGELSELNSLQNEQETLETTAETTEAVQETAEAIEETPEGTTAETPILVETPPAETPQEFRDRVKYRPSGFRLW